MAPLYGLMTDWFERRVLGDAIDVDVDVYVKVEFDPDPDAKNSRHSSSGTLG